MNFKKTNKLTLFCRKIMKERIKFAENSGLNKFAPILRSWSFPRSYCLPKFKDFRKIRPITGYQRHPLKNIHRLIGAALMHLLDSSPLRGFDGPTVVDIFKFFESTRYFARIVSHTGLKPFIFSFDIKEMYTNLVHADILNAINSLLKEAQSRLEASRWEIHYLPSWQGQWSPKWNMPICKRIMMI